jgi:hypothetical protein
MKRRTYTVTISLKFDDLTLEEANNLETFMDGLTARDDWGEPDIGWDMKFFGMRDPKKAVKPMTAKKLLELEKEHAGKEKK